MKRIIAFSMMILCLVVFTIPTFAIGNVQNVGIVTYEEILWKNGGLTTYGVNKPKEVWDITSDGTYKFSGVAGYNDLYSEYLITGKTSYSVTVNNNRAATDTLTMEVYKKGLIFDSVIKTETVKGQESKTFSVTGLSKTDKIYIKYMAPLNCDGTIK